MNLIVRNRQFNNFNALAFALILLVGFANPVVGQTTTNYSDFYQAGFAEVPVSTGFSVEAIFGVRIVPNRTSTNGGYGDPGIPGGDPDNPGDRAGYFSTNNPAVFRPASNVVLNFSDPIVAFGVTFTHFDHPRDNFAQWELPARLRVFDGLDGSGNLVGSITSTGLIATTGGTADFVGVIANDRIIRSAILDGTGTYSAFGVDGYGLTITSIPEPGSTSVVFLGFVLCVLSRKRQAPTKGH